MRSGIRALLNVPRVCVWTFVGSAAPLTLANQIPQLRTHRSNPSLATFLKTSLTAFRHPQIRPKHHLIRCSPLKGPRLRHTTTMRCNTALVMGAPPQARDRQAPHTVPICKPRVHITRTQAQTQGIAPRGATPAGTFTAHVTRIPMQTQCLSGSRSSYMVPLASCGGCRNTVVTPHVLSRGASRNSAISYSKRSAT